MLTRITLLLAAAFLLVPAVSADRIHGLEFAGQAEWGRLLAERAGIPVTIAGFDDDLLPICVRPAHPHFPVYLDGDDEPTFWVDDDDVPFDDHPPPLDGHPPGDAEGDGKPVASVPEPATLALFGSGLVAMAIGARQRLKRGA
ncbi:MAG: PEP-CTERM sorting domain-containing protein [Candidatus Acidiferrales bacterium]